MTGLSPLLLPVLCVAAMLTVLVGTRATPAANRGTETHWCGAGLLIIMLLGWLLSDAQDLLSSTERLAGIDLGVWLLLADFGIDDVSWTFQITPLAAWWAIGCGGLMCLIGWVAHRSGESLPFGWLGGAIGLVTCGLVFAYDLLTAFLLCSTQGLLCGFWLAWQARTAEAVQGVRRLGMTLLISDMIGLIGVLLAGLVCRTFDISSLDDAEFLQRCWQDRPALCGLAGTCLFLGLLGRCAVFPFCRGSQCVAEFRGPANGLVFGVCLWPAVMWFFLRVQPLLSLAPETVSVVQGLSLIGAVIGAFIASAQTDLRRTTALLATSQLGLLMSAFVVQDHFSPIWLCVVIAPLAVASVTMFLVRSTFEHSSWLSRVTVGMALITTAGCCPSPTFWLAGRSVERFQAAETVVAEDVVEIEHDFSQSAIRNPQSAISHPLPATTWTAAWCLWSFFAAFAAWRGGRVRECAGRNDGEQETRRKKHDAEFSRSVTSSLPLSWLLLLTMIAGMAGSGWLAQQELGEILATNHWPLAAAVAASLAGLALSAWVCRDPELADERWEQLGSWTRLARREFYLEEAFLVGLELPVRAVAQLVRLFDWTLINPAGRWLGGWLTRGVVAAVEELRNEPASFYAGTVLLTVATWLVTWLALAG